MNYLNLTIDQGKIKQISSLGLAHIGDCVFELMTRSHLVEQGLLTSKNLHRATTDIVKATSQAKMVDKVIDDFTEEERSVYMRGRNSKTKMVPKNTTHEEYSKATAVECLFGYLYLQGKYDRLNQLYDKMLSL